MGQSPERKSLSAGLENILVLEGEDGRKEGQSSRKAGQHHLEYKCWEDHCKGTVCHCGETRSNGRPWAKKCITSHERGPWESVQKLACECWKSNFNKRRRDADGEGKYALQQWTEITKERKVKEGWLVKVQDPVNYSRFYWISHPPQTYFQNGIYSYNNIITYGVYMTPGRRQALLWICAYINSLSIYS